MAGWWRCWSTASTSIVFMRSVSSVSRLLQARLRQCEANGFGRVSSWKRLGRQRSPVFHLAAARSLSSPRPLPPAKWCGWSQALLVRQGDPLYRNFNLLRFPGSRFRLDIAARQVQLKTSSGHTPVPICGWLTWRVQLTRAAIIVRGALLAGCSPPWW